MGDARVFRMATNENSTATEDPTATEPSGGNPATRQAQRRNFGLGMFIAFLTAILALLAVVFIWMGVIPSLVLLLLCVPLGLLAARLLRRGKPVELSE